jgi:phosphoserine phosphatase
MIDGVAMKLGIPKTRIFANNLLFDSATGTYSGFDANEPTSRAGGKAKVVGMLKEQYKYSPIVMVGDGATDMEARPPADLFIGFGGIVVRANVRDGADWFVTDFKEMIDALEGEEEAPQSGGSGSSSSSSSGKL